MNEARLMEFVGKAVTDLGTMVNGSLIVIGDKLGLYKAVPAGVVVGSGGERLRGP